MLVVPEAKRRQKLIAYLPSTFDMIHLMFQSDEVVEQLKLLRELVPDWLSERTSSTGDILCRRSQGSTCWNRPLHGEESQVVAGDGTSNKQEKAGLKRSKNSVVSTREGQQKTPNVVSAHATLAKESAASALEKKYVVVM